MTQEVYDQMMDAARQARKSAKDVFENEPGPGDDAAKLLADMVAVGTHIGLDPKQANFG